MDLAQLQSFVAVARRRSFTLAAQELDLTQPGVSRQVQKLEQELGVALLDRRHGGVELTPEGHRFRAYAEDALDRYERLRRELQSVDAVSGELLIAASTTPGEFLVPGLVARFTALHPNVRPRVFIADSAEVLTELTERRWDLGFVGVHLPRRGLSYDVVAEDEVVLAVPAGHPFAARATVELAELEGQPFIEREGGSGTMLSVRAAVAKHGLELPAWRVAMVLNTTQAVVSAVQSGYGLGLVSSLALADRPAGRIALVRLAELSLRRPLYLVQEQRRPLPPVAAAFTAWVRYAGQQTSVPEGSDTPTASSAGA